MDYTHVVVFLIAFAFGMALGMALFTGSIGVISERLTKKGGHLPPAYVISLWVSYFSIALGLVLAAISVGEIYVHHSTGSAEGSHEL